VLFEADQVVAAVVAHAQSHIDMIQFGKGLFQMRQRQGRPVAVHDDCLAITLLQMMRQGIRQPFSQVGSPLRDQAKPIRHQFLKIINCRCRRICEGKINPSAAASGVKGGQRRVLVEPRCGFLATTIKEAFISNPSFT
jgi:hypothetical protein